MTIIIVTIFGFLGLIGFSALYMFYWAAKTGQLREFEKGARVIFDAGEPIGRMTDRFPTPMVAADDANRSASRA